MVKFFRDEFKVIFDLFEAIEIVILGENGQITFNFLEYLCPLYSVGKFFTLGIAESNAKCLGFLRIWINNGHDVVTE